MVSAIYNGAAYVTAAGCFGAFFFKQIVVGRTSKVVKEAENVTAGFVASEICISVAVLVLASSETARILLSHDTNQVARSEAQFGRAKATSHLSLNPFATEFCSISSSTSSSSNPIATESRSISPSTCFTPCTLFLSTSPVQKPKCLSIDSDPTLDDDDDRTIDTLPPACWSTVTYGAT
ncbi:hypothetical protein EDB19DRAFT_1902977 [Suillus lakei]|nr:hypothetical protein EDB19DRAFT_1902977 [Suillus lakei]